MLPDGDMVREYFGARIMGTVFVGVALTLPPGPPAGTAGA